jgi:hypothetical protein
MTITIQRRTVILAVALFIAVIAILLPGQIRQINAGSDAQNTPCPTPAPTVTPREVGAAEQAFDHGLMIWVQDTGTIYVMIDPSGQHRGGSVQTYQDNWHEGLADTNPNLPIPAGRAQPTRGFGYLWNTNAAVRDALGWPLVPATGYTVLIVTQGDKTWLNGQAYNTYQITGNTWQEVDVFRH